MKPLLINREDLPFIHTFSGTKFHHLWPVPEEVNIEDIAHALSNLCRFTGHTKTFYSVSEHSVRVSYLCKPEYQLWGLLHDASESYMNDLSRPLKYANGLENYRKIEQLCMNVIIERFELYPRFEPIEVKNADQKLLVTEQRDLMCGIHSGSIVNHLAGIVPLTEKIEPMSSEQAKNTYLMRFYELTNTDRFYAKTI